MLEAASGAAFKPVGRRMFPNGYVSLSLEEPAGVGTYEKTRFLSFYFRISLSHRGHLFCPLTGSFFVTVHELQVIKDFLS